MNTALLVIAVFVLYLVAYHTYGRYLARRIFCLNPDRTTPAHEVNDGIDFVPSRTSLVFGHHFTSIAGTGPIVGPAIAVVWGWVPALLWVLIGSIVMGAVHDFGSLIISMRHKGRTIADLSGNVVNARVRLLFMIVVLIGLWIVLAIFGLVIATIFKLYPQSVLPVFAQIPIAVVLGIWIKRGGQLLPASIIAVVAMYATILWSASIDWTTVSIIPLSLTTHISEIAIWSAILMIYVFIASVLPVNVLLQPRDFINAWQLLIAMGLLLIAILYTNPPIVAESIRLHPEPSLKGTPAPPLFPFLFITIACGAISGFHCLVSSGCSSRQLKSELDAKPIGYGSMLTEGFLATLVIIACIAGIGLGTNAGTLSGTEAWSFHYAQWGNDAGLGSKLAPFIVGSANMIEQLGISHAIATTIMGVFVASFAATTLDSATRLQRYVIAELAGVAKKTKSNPIARFAQNRFGATAIATTTGLTLALSDIPARGLENAGLGGLTLWPIFGATNQLLAAMALLTIGVWLMRERKPTIPVFVPFTMMLIITASALTLLVRDFVESDRVMLAGVALLKLTLLLWAALEAMFIVQATRKQRGSDPPCNDHHQPE
jgi:carbon starvation protein